MTPACGRVCLVHVLDALTTYSGHLGVCNEGKVGQYSCPRFLVDRATRQCGPCLPCAVMHTLLRRRECLLHIVATQQQG